jgi:glycosyltransferase involved in cell wall biosynthesis
VTSTLIANVMDFDYQLPVPDEYAADLRSVLGIGPDQRLLLQPTRVVPRKRIEQSIELARRIKMDSALVVSHSAGDEGLAYQNYLQDYAELIGVPLILAADIFNHRRGETPDGRKVYAIADAYQQADLVTYPSRVEGFGNAFLETIYYRRPIVMSSYEIFKTDIEPKGFKVIGFEDFIDKDCVCQARAVLDNPDLAAEMTEHNFELGRIYYSYQTLETRLGALISNRLSVQKRAGMHGGYTGYKKPRC